jgi:dihydroorotase (EC 3.5.2.3)
MSIAPARLFGLPYGTLADGAPADVVLFSTSRTTTFSAFRSLSANSPWAGKTLRGRIERTFVGGSEVYRAGAAPTAG